MLKRYISKGDVQSRTPHSDVTLHIVIPLRGQFKGERGKRRHLLNLSKTKNLRVNILRVINLIIAVQDDTNSRNVPWGFVVKEGENMSLEEINDVILEMIEIIKHCDVR